MFILEDGNNQRATRAIVISFGDIAPGARDASELKWPITSDDKRRCAYVMAWYAAFSYSAILTLPIADSMARARDIYRSRRRRAFIIHQKSRILLPSSSMILYLLRPF